MAEGFVTDEVLWRAIAGYDHYVWTKGGRVGFEQAMQASIEAVAPFLYRAGREAGLREAAKMARNACLVLPDGGSPTEEERLVAEAAHDRILALIGPRFTPPGEQ